MTIHHLPLLLALTATFLLLATSCGKDNDLTTEIEGAYIGSYEDDAGVLTLYNVKVEVTRKSKSEIECEMTWIEGFPSAIFEGEMEDKTHFNVPAFSGEDENYSGSGVLENDTLKIDFIPESDPSAIEHYAGKRQ